MPLLDAFPGLEAIVSAAQLHRLGWVIVHSLWQAAAVAAVLAVGLRLLPRRSVFALQARYALATLALAALPIACVATYALVAPPAAAYPTASPPTTMPVASAPRRMVVVPAAIAERRIDGATALQQSAAQVPVDIRVAFVALAQQTATAISPWLPCCAALWLAGVTAAAGRLGVGWWLTRRLVAQAIAPADAHWQARLDRWKSVLGIAGPIRLLASARIDVPVVVGWLEPVVLWPLAALTGMPPDQIDAILAHELAHIRRHDVFVNLLQSCIETLFFHHPAAWWISAQVRAEREHCADDLAIRGLEHARAGSTHSYAMALISLEERRRRTALAVAADGGSLVDRVGRLAGIEPAAGHPARLAAATLVLATVIASAATVAATPRPALAADAKAGKLPKDTNRIKSLTPEQARKLAAEFAGKVGEIEIKGHGKVKLPGCLPLNGLQSLDAETAKALAEFKGQQLHLNGLTTLSADAASALAKFKGQSLFLETA